MADPFEVLQKSIWFQGLKENDLRRLYKDSRMRPVLYADGELVLEESMLSQHALFIVVTGALEVIYIVEQRDLLEQSPIYRFTCSEVVGILEIIQQEKRNLTTVKAVGETKVLRLEIPDFRAFLLEYPDLGYSFCRGLARIISQEGQTFAETKVRDAAQRLASALQAEQKRVDAEEKHCLIEFRDKKRLAEMLHLQPITVGHLLQKFVLYGALKVAGGYTRSHNGKELRVGTRYKIDSRDKLDEIARGLSDITSTQRGS